MGSHEKQPDNKKHEIRNKTEEEENTKLLEIVSRVEKSVVEAITKTHEKNQDDLINQLQQDLQNERNVKRQIDQILETYKI